MPKLIMGENQPFRDLKEKEKEIMNMFSCQLCKFLPKSRH